MNIFNIGNKKIEPIIVKDYSSIRPKVLVCSKCKEPVSRVPFYQIYSCNWCSSLTNNVEWKEDSVVV